MNKLAIIPLALLFAATANAEDDIKKAIYADCTHAQQLILSTTTEQRTTVTSFINNLLKAKDSLANRNQPGAGTPNRIGIISADEPKLGELVAINNTERDQSAKECGLSLLPKLLPESLRIIPTLFAVESDNTNKELLRVEAPRAIARMASNVLEESEILSLIDLSVRELELHRLAAAENILFELFSRKSDFIVDRLIISSIPEKRIAEIVSLLMVLSDDRLQLAQNLIKEGGKKRAVGLLLLEAIPPQQLLREEIIKSAFESLDVQEFQGLRNKILSALQTEPNPISAAIIGTELHLSLKGAETEEKKNIVTLASLLPTLSLELENEVIPLVKIHQPDLIDSLITLSKRPTLKKKLRDDVVKLAKDPSKEYFAKAYTAWYELQEPDPELLSFSSALLTKELTTKDRYLVESILLKYVSKLPAADQKKVVTTLKGGLKEKGATAPYKASIIRLLATLAPQSVTTQQISDLLMNGNCALLDDDALVQRSKLTPDALFSRLTACVQVGSSTMGDVSQMLHKDFIPIDVRRVVLSQWISNQLYDRRFRAELCDQAALLGVPLDKIAPILLQLATDKDENVWEPALSAIAQYQKAAAYLVPELVKLTNIAPSFRLQQLRTALIIYTEFSNFSFDALNGLILEELEKLRYSIDKPFEGLNEELQNDLYIQMIEEYPVDLRAKVLLELAKSPLRANDKLERTIISQLSSKVESVSDAALSCTLAKGINAADAVPHLYDSIFSISREEVFTLISGGTRMQGQLLINQLKSQHPREAELNTFKVFERKLAS